MLHADAPKEVDRIDDAVLALLTLYVGKMPFVHRTELGNERALAGGAKAATLQSAWHIAHKANLAIGI
jgi:hypothetical protein